MSLAQKINILYRCLSTVYSAGISLWHAVAPLPTSWNLMKHMWPAARQEEPLRATPRPWRLKAPVPRHQGNPHNLLEVYGQHVLQFQTLFLKVPRNQEGAAVFLKSYIVAIKTDPKIIKYHLEEWYAHTHLCLFIQFSTNLTKVMKLSDLLPFKMHGCTKSRNGSQRDQKNKPPQRESRLPPKDLSR